MSAVSTVTENIQILPTQLLKGYVDSVEIRPRGTSTRRHRWVSQGAGVSATLVAARGRILNLESADGIRRNDPQAKQPKLSLKQLRLACVFVRLNLTQAEKMCAVGCRVVW